MQDRYQNIPIYGFRNKYYKSPRYPEIPLHPSDIYIYTSKQDRLDKLALEYYGDKSLWWIISLSNDIPKDSFHIPNGFQLRIPQEIEDIIIQMEKINK